MGKEQQPLSDVEREVLIEELSQGTRFSHGIYGHFGEGGHRLKEVRGPSRLPKIVLQYERAYADTFDKYGQPHGPQFRARVLGSRTDQGGVFVMVFLDRQGDKRPGSHTQYAIAIPNKHVERIYPIIESDPSVLIDVFRRVYPTYDRSGGSLVIDPEHAEVMPIPPIVLDERSPSVVEFQRINSPLI